MNPLQGTNYRLTVDANLDKMNPNMATEINLFGPDSKNQANFTIKSDRSGIDLHDFLLEGVDHQVTQTLAYVPYDQGIRYPGTGQIGLYRVSRQPDSKLLALIKDYSRSSEIRPWGVYLLDLTDSAFELLDKYAEDPRFGTAVYLGLALINR